MRKAVLIICCFITVIKLFAQNNPSHSDVLWVTTPNHSDWLYKVNEKAKIKVALYEYGILQDNLEITYSVGPELMPADMSGNVVLKNGEAIIDIGTMKEPGFRDCQMQVKLNGEIYKHHIKV